MATKGFTKINNSIIFDADLSLEAIGLYVKLQYLSNIDSFSIRRDHIKSISGYGETAFRRVWKELKDKGILIEIKARNKGKYEYVYTLKTDLSNNTAVTTASIEENKTQHIDSDGNIPIEGQMDIDDVLRAEQKEPVVNENITEVVKTTGFNNSQVSELLEDADNNIDKVINGYKYTMCQKNVKDIFAYTKWAIKNIKATFSSIERNEVTIKSTFNHFKQRTYDFDKLQKALLYGEPYELPI